MFDGAPGDSYCAQRMSFQEAGSQDKNTDILEHKHVTINHLEAKRVDFSKSVGGQQLADVHLYLHMIFSLSTGSTGATGGLQPLWPKPS